MKKFLLKDERSVTHCVLYINSIDDLSTPLEVTIKNFVKLNKEETTRAAQNRLRWLWITDIAKEMGLSKDECNHYLKVRFLLPIFVRDNEEWALIMLSIRQLECDGYKEQAKHLNSFVTDEKRLSLIDSTVIQGAEFLREVQIFAHENLKMTLRTDNDSIEDLN